MARHPEHLRPISQILRIHPRFLRSVRLETDFSDPRSSKGFVVTPVSQEALERVLQSFRPDSTQRAWRIAGDYGSGKTAWALTLARIAQGAKSDLPGPLQALAKHYRILPALATGDAEPLGVTVLRAIGKAASSRNRPTNDEVLAALRQHIQRACKQGHSGVLLLLDEIGKNLEYAVRNPDADDIYLLQRIAEEASRSGSNSLTVVVLLHQGVAAYAAGLDSTSRREWEKVSGRFQEIVYVHPLEQVASLVAATFNAQTERIPPATQKELRNAMKQSISAGLYGASASAALEQLAVALFPLHPAALPVIVRTMRRFGQNERSLFSFIASAEPLGMQQHCASSLSQVGLYRIHHFFDYVAANLASAIHESPTHTLWTVVQSVLVSASALTAEERHILKTVAMLSLLDSPDLPATAEVISAAVGLELPDTERALKGFSKRGVVYQRGSVKGYCLWPHTSVNLDERFHKAAHAVPASAVDVGALCNHVRSEQLVPRAYYVKTGTLRYADVKLVPAGHITDLAALEDEANSLNSDLVVRIVIPTDRSQQTAICQSLQKQRSRIPSRVVIAVSDPLSSAIAALKDVVYWNWVKNNTPQLAGDRFAREELSRQITHSEKILSSRLGGLENLAIPTNARLTWYDNGGEHALRNGRQLLTFLGEKCTQLYSCTPHIPNELINRRSPSSAAVAARTKLLDAMAKAPTEPNLGMDDTKRPAEMALYMSLLRRGNFHVPDGNGAWEFRLPDGAHDTCNLLPALQAITERLKEAGLDALVPVPSIFQVLGSVPFGIRAGLQPFILAIYLVTHGTHAAVYEDGTYVPLVDGEMFLRLVKEPQAFSVQYCALEAVREDAFRKILSVLGRRSLTQRPNDLMDVVKPLMIFVSQEIHEYSRNTQTIDSLGKQVRKALLNSREPSTLVFRTLPEACGFPPIEDDQCVYAEDFAKSLRSALHAIQEAYSNLLQRVATGICSALKEVEPLRESRSSIGQRARNLSVRLTEPALKAFALRLADETLDYQPWLESLATLLAKKSPQRWSDMDEAEFYHRLEVFSARFRRTELSLMGSNANLNGHACRIFLTKSDGTEVGELVNWAALEPGRLAQLESEICQLIKEHGQYALAATMRALWSELPAVQEDQPQ